jgi:dTMP kinase
MTRVGRLIAFEGGEGSGKSTQARLLAKSLDAVLTFEPGGTPIGASVRALVLDPASAAMTDRTEALLMAADRAQHVATVIEPALAAGRHVVTDRYVGSTLAYQGYGRGLDVDALRLLCAWATGGRDADVNVLLDVPYEASLERLAAARPDRMEAESRDFHQRVADGFRSLAGDDAARWVVVDGVGPVDEVAQRVLAALDGRLS